MIRGYRYYCNIYAIRYYFKKKKKVIRKEWLSQLAQNHLTKKRIFLNYTVK